MSGLAIGVIGAGAWGTALAVHLGELGHGLRLWARDPDLRAKLRAQRQNPVYLPGVALPEAVGVVDELADAVAGASLVVCAVPSPYARRVYRRLAPLRIAATVVVTTKGLESDTGRLPLEVAGEELGAGVPLCVLSGPSFAAEVARGLPAAAVVAAEPPEVAEEVQRCFAGGALRLYTNRDVFGVQFAGAAKNVVALGAGILDGLELGRSALAGFVTRGLGEIRRIGVALGAQPETFAGLAGIGDLVATCTGELSRNRRVGLALGRGARLEAVLASMRAVPEGVYTARALRDLARARGVEAPIVEQMCRILYEGATPTEAVQALLQRPLKAEDS